MHLNTKTSTYPFSWLSRDASIRARSGRAQGSSPSSPTRTGSTSSDKLDRPTSPSNRQPLQALPPASNPRGELSFSSKVDPQFRDGYERFRSEWERRRQDKASRDGADSVHNPTAAKSRKPNLGPLSTESTRPNSLLYVQEHSQSSLEDLQMDQRGRKRPTTSLDSSPTSSRSPSPDFYHSRPSSGSSTGGPPSPRSLPPNDLPLDELAEYDIAGVKGPDPFLEPYNQVTFDQEEEDVNSIRLATPTRFSSR